MSLSMEASTDNSQVSAYVSSFGQAKAMDQRAVRGMIRLMRQNLAAMPTPPVPRGFVALQTLPEGLLVAMLRRFLRSPTAARGFGRGPPPGAGGRARVRQRLACGDGRTRADGRTDACLCEGPVGDRRLCLLGRIAREAFETDVLSKRAAYYQAELPITAIIRWLQ